MLPVAEAQARDPGPARPAAGRMGGAAAGAGPRARRGSRRTRDQPPVAVSAMDGYAVRAADTLEVGPAVPVVGEAAAGRRSRQAIGPGEAVRIFTGGAVPAGADAILIQEDAEAARRRRCASPARSRRAPSCAPAGLDFRRGLDRAASRQPARRARRWALPPRWATSGCRCAAGRASASWPPATSCAGPARRRRQPDRQLQHRHARRPWSRPGAAAGRSRHLPRRWRGARGARPRRRRASTCWSPPAAPRSATTTSSSRRSAARA